MEDLGDAAAVHELIGSLVVEAPVLVAGLAAAIKAKRPLDAQRVTHTLKSATGSFGLETLAALCREAETAARASDLDRVAALLPEIARAWEASLRALDEWKARHPA